MEIKLRSSRSYKDTKGLSLAVESCVSEFNLDVKNKHDGDLLRISGEEDIVREKYKREDEKYVQSLYSIVFSASDLENLVKFSLENGLVSFSDNPEISLACRHIAESLVKTMNIEPAKSTQPSKDLVDQLRSHNRSKFSDL